MEPSSQRVAAAFHGCSSGTGSQIAAAMNEVRASASGAANLWACPRVHLDEQIAAATQTSEAVIRKRVSRGLASLRRKLEGPTS